MLCLEALDVSKGCFLLGLKSDELVLHASEDRWSASLRALRTLDILGSYWCTKLNRATTNDCIRVAISTCGGSGRR